MCLENAHQALEEWLADLVSDAEGLAEQLDRAAQSIHKLTEFESQNPLLYQWPKSQPVKATTLNQFKGQNRVVVFRQKAGLGIWAPRGVVTGVHACEEALHIFLEGSANGK